MTLAHRLRLWFEKNQRDLPWRKTRDPYRIWLSEVMLQQTRVAAVIPYYERFLLRFPDYQTLAAANESDLLAMWSGLGYYSRARNLQKAARLMVQASGFPNQYEAIRDFLYTRMRGYREGSTRTPVAPALVVGAEDGQVDRLLREAVEELRAARLALERLAGGGPAEGPRDV